MSVLKTKDGSLKADGVIVSSRLITEPGSVQMDFSNNSNDLYAVKTYIRRFSTGSSGARKNIMRVKRQWWGQGNFEINVRGTYYSGSEDFHVQLTGHSSIQYGGTMGHQKMWGDTDRISLSSRQTSSPATPGVVGWQDVYINLPAYNQYIVTIKVVQSEECETDAEMRNHHNCYRIND